MNYGETLAYWYLRLNGFLPLANFVLHRPHAPRHFADADADILAIRFPHVFEEVGGQANDWDNARFNDWGLRQNENTVCVICEVKAGRYDQHDLDSPFGQQRLEYAVHRLGVLPHGDVRPLCDELVQAAVVYRPQLTFLKVLASSSALRLGQFDELKPCREIELSDCTRFIRKRMSDHRRNKNAARMFFPSELVQFFAWEAGVHLEDDLVEDEE